MARIALFQIKNEGSMRISLCIDQRRYEKQSRTPTCGVQSSACEAKEC